MKGHTLTVTNLDLTTISVIQLFKNSQHGQIVEIGVDADIGKTVFQNLVFDQFHNGASYAFYGSLLCYGQPMDHSIRVIIQPGPFDRGVSRLARIY